MKVINGKEKNSKIYTSADGNGKDGLRFARETNIWLYGQLALIAAL